MARLLVGTQWYETVGSQSWYERDYEAVVIDRAEHLFKHWRCVPFSETVVGDDGTRKKPDLALVDHHYREWWVVEVELAHHDLNGHVLPQVDAFRTGTYEARHAAALHARAADLELGRLEAMMLGEPPRVIVLVDSPHTRWRPALHERGVGLAIVEPFRDEANQLILRLNGDQPEPPAKVLSRCSRHQVMRRLWKVHSPASLPGSPDEPLVIEYEGISNPWTRVTLHDAVMLQAGRGDILADLAAVDLVRRDDGALMFTAITTLRSRRPR